MRRVITFGTFDLLHQGHLSILRRARQLGDYLIVGVSSDQLNDRKGKKSYFNEIQRIAYIQELEYVDEVFLEESLEMKDEYVKEFKADLLVMGDDWKGGFDWVSCETRYLPRTKDISSTKIKEDLSKLHKCTVALFGDTYIDKHMDCALSIVNELTANNIAPIFTKEDSLPTGIQCDCLVYFNRPKNQVPLEYSQKKKVLIDHGASHLKWFLGSQERLDFFDLILTAGPDHIRALESLFGKSFSSSKVRASGFIKAKSLLSEPSNSKQQICKFAKLDPSKPIILFAPTWHITANADIVEVIDQLSGVENHIACFHPETRHIPFKEINLVENKNGIISDLIKHCDLLISDLSSTIFEAAALGKPVIQLLLKEYPDNEAILYDFPLSAGTSEHFCGGLPARPTDIYSAISTVLKKDPNILEAIKQCQKRILSGTYISNDAASSITHHIFQACKEGVSETIKQPESVSAIKAQLNVSSVAINKFFAQNRVIAHAGGDYSSIHASNSLEAITSAMKNIDLIEVDITLGNNCLLVAHDGFEAKYGFTQSFSEISEEEMLAAKFDGQLKPISIQTMLSLSREQKKGVIFDIKPIRESYIFAIQKLKEAIDMYGDMDYVALQCYCIDDYVEALRVGYRRVVLAAWKFFFKDPLGQDFLDCAKKCISINPDIIWGISVPFANKHMETNALDSGRLLMFHSLWKRVFIHNAPRWMYCAILNANCGVFADGVDERFEFKDIPHEFKWQQYLFLNNDLPKSSITSQLGAAKHYLSYGASESRPTSYDIEDSFSYSSYINSDARLRKLSINGFNSAASHYTKSRLNNKT